MTRTTVVLEDDILADLRQEARVRKTSFRKTLNDVSRDGLAAAEQRRATRTVFRVEPRDFGLKAGFSYDSISQLIEVGEEADDGPSS
jgi:hypothetical protein